MVFLFFRKCLFRDAQKIKPALLQKLPGDEHGTCEVSMDPVPSNAGGMPIPKVPIKDRLDVHQNAVVPVRQLFADSTIGIHAASYPVDELYEVLKKFATEDHNGNGKADEIPLVGIDVNYRSDVVVFLVNAFVYCNDTNVFDVTDGKVWVPYTTDEYRQALIYLNKLYSEGLLSPLFYTISAA